ncbi:UNVERIFIED_CONTAM: hypothetical protein Sradi_6654500 [Sesamum radiatum]|uniref:Uncharacterized protein n=1 Tax=Sesamum radiatum TaxID=300843 RepID=A0AAW2JNL1_SESRA
MVAITSDEEKHLLGSPILINTSYPTQPRFMHIEKNIFDNIFNTVMDIKGKMKDNMNAFRDLKIICNRLELELDERRPNVISKVVYTLGKEQKMRICEGIHGLKFPDGYASNLVHCVHMMELWMHGMKSHDCHIFMQKLIPIAFCDPNGLQVVLEAAGTSWRQLHENDNDNKDEGEDSSGDDETDDEEYEAT